MDHSKITIVGLGLIGGSLARALRLRMGLRSITAVDRDASALLQAERDGVITEGLTGPDERIYASDMIFLCAPVKESLEVLSMLSGKVGDGCIITDVCSTKGELTAFADAMEKPLCYIGGHPMAGSEKAGYEAGSAHLFENAYYVLTPSRGSDIGALEKLKQLVEGIGAIPVVMEAREHDRVTGAISHVPHIIASALVNMVREADKGDGMMKLLAAGGFRDITRIASSSPVMWQNIAFSNRDRISELLDSFIGILEQYRHSVDSGCSGETLDFFSLAKAYRDSLPPVSTGLIRPVFELAVDVPDQPGIIGDIATLLGKNNINIKNINVSNSREFEQGCLRITLYDDGSADAGCALLSDAGYKVYKDR